MVGSERVMDELPNQDVTKRLEKVLIVSRTEASQVKDLLIKNGFKIVERNPDFVVCYGGDGTVLFSERKFPQVPKLVVKRTSICRNFDYTLYNVKNILPKIRDGKFRIRREIKLETKLENGKLVGLNEIQIRAKLPIYAVRFSVFVDGKEFDNLIGDGVIVATPFGSTGYYKSTGGRQFRTGIGISFNNLHNKEIKSFVVPESSLIRVRVNRGPTWVLADNYQKFFELKDNVVTTIRKSKSVANFIYVPRVH
jgi:NAD+ kinase